MEIEGYPDYMIYEDGRIWSKPKEGGGNKFLKPSPNGRGYLQVGLCKDGKRKQMTVHRLLGIAFIPNPENKREIDHIDNNRQNNNISNLRWVTPSENSSNRKPYGAIPFRGVTKHGNRFKARTTIDDKTKHIGTYDTPEEASESYLKYCRDNNIYCRENNI